MFVNAFMIVIVIFTGAKVSGHFELQEKLLKTVWNDNKPSLF